MANRWIARGEVREPLALERAPEARQVGQNDGRVRSCALALSANEDKSTGSSHLTRPPNVRLHPSLKQPAWPAGLRDDARDNPLASQEQIRSGRSTPCAQSSLEIPGLRTTSDRTTLHR